MNFAQKFCHAISKDTRKKIIEILSRRRSRRELAKLLGITPPAVIKYLKGLTHPSDEVVCKALEIADEDELLAIKKEIVKDILGSLEALYKWIIEGQLISQEDVKSLDLVFSSIKLSLLGARSPLMRISS
jgi:predicted transcriptional regulator